MEPYGNPIIVWDMLIEDWNETSYAYNHNLNFSNEYASAPSILFMLMRIEVTTFRSEYMYDNEDTYLVIKKK